VTESHTQHFSQAPDAALLFPGVDFCADCTDCSLGVIRPITARSVDRRRQNHVPFFVLKAGEIEVISPIALDEILIATVRPAQFTGDISMILGRPAQMRLV